MSNCIALIGTLGQDAQVKTLPSGSKVLNLNIANRIWDGTGEKTQWFNVSVYGKKAEGKLVNHLNKGQLVFISGQLSVRHYQHNGENKTSLEINASVIELAGKGSGNGQQANDNPPVEAYKDY